MNKSLPLIMSNADLHYIAGVLDKAAKFKIEGHGSVGAGGTYKGLIQLFDPNPKLIQFLIDTLGGVGKPRPSLDGPGDAYQVWRLVGFAALPALKALIPFLRYKIEHATHLQSFLEYQRAAYKTMKTQKPDKSVGYSSKNWETLANYKDQLDKLNCRK